jgi:hypothetical protein
MALACVLAGALLTAGSASAASRGFKLHNTSSHALRLEAARRVPTFVCVDPSRCVPTHYPMEFEGRPGNGAVLHPAKVQDGVLVVHTHVWELKYGFSPLGGVQYAANLWYKIAGTGASVEYTIETWSTSNESSCKIIGTSHFTCTAEGTKLTFRNH